MLASLKWTLSFLYLWFHKKRSKPLFPFDHRSKDLRKSGITSLPESWFRECPRPLCSDENAVDSLSFHGVSNDGEVLSVHIGRRHGRSAEVHVYLKLASGEEYQLPFQPHSHVWNSEVSKNFVAAGLTFEVLEPLRRWRIRFNGLLRKGIAKDWNELSTSEVRSVKFNFIWRSMYNYIAFPQDLEPKILAQLLARETSPSLFQRPCDILQEEWYEQFGQISGTIDIEGQEQFEFMVRGLKDRRHGLSDWRKVKKDLSIMGVLKNGNAFHLFGNDVDNGMKDFVYGYVIPSHNMTIHHVKKWQRQLDEFELQDQFKLLLVAGGTEFFLEMDSVGLQFKLFKGSNWNFEVNVGVYSVSVNNIAGFAIARRGIPYYDGCPVAIQKSFQLLEEQQIEFSRRFVAKFEDPECQNSSIVGGKGASLSLMAALLRNSQNLSLKFSVPDGVCLTKMAFEYHFQSNMLIRGAVASLEDVAWKRSPGILNEECNRLVNSLRCTEMALSLKDELWFALVNKFGEDFESVTKFAVRSSALGEDGEEMSAAGQNETFLGVKGFQNICSSVVKCWASQFAFRSVEYKRQCGQLINSGMAVVVQEMVAADIAGVLFTRHPLSGSPAYMMIASNYGLGESVVSATADPDTVVLKRSWTNRLEIHERQIGAKKIKITMSDDEGTTTSDNSVVRSSQFSLSDSLALRLGEIAVFIEHSFGGSRDIEWAVKNEEISLLQARPVTTESVMTDFEVIHEFDSATRTDHEYHTTANLGEVMAGSFTPLTITTEHRSQNTSIFMNMTWKADVHRYDPTVLDGPSCFFGHFFLDRVHFKSLLTEETKSAMTKAAEIAFFGRVIDDDVIAKMCAERYGSPPMKLRLQLMKYALRGALLGRCLLNRTANKYRNFVVPVTSLKTSTEVYRTIEDRYYSDWPQTTDTHLCMTSASSMWNLIVLNMLVGPDGEYTLEKYTDFATLIGGSNGIESGDVPFALQELARAIADEIAPQVFAQLQIRDATFWCMHTSTKVSRLFCEFLQRHGHRGLKEFELISVTWGMEPERLVRVLQGLVKNSNFLAKNIDVKETKGSSAISTQLSSFKRWILPYILSKARQGVRNREQSKSMLIKMVDGYRYAYRHLAKLMVQEGLIPDPELIFFFTHEEIGIMIQTRSCSLIRRAKQRRRLYPEMDSLVFEEMIVGFPKPISMNKEFIATNDVIKGYPVCKGEARGVARVVSFEDMDTIEAGDILITRATDIGWSPYFPILRGVVTEIGGLISHGAVVAREFGLPCIVAAQGATQFFTSGDLVCLNANEGCVYKIDKFIDIHL